MGNDKNESAIALNRYIAQCGITSRRKAVELIKQGLITVNHAVVDDPAYKVGSKDTIRYKKHVIKPESPVYVLLNKPAGYVTTVSDPHQTKTVMQLIQSASKKRLFPVGRLDKETTGLLLFTNDGELAQELLHPKGEISKEYHVILDRVLSEKDMLKIRKGVYLRDGKAYADRAYYVSGSSKRKVGVVIHSGKNRIIRRMFKQLGYNVTRLDRVMYAGLTKRGIIRGKWRFLKPDEVAKLKKGITKKEGTSGPNRRGKVAAKRKPTTRSGKPGVKKSPFKKKSSSGLRRKPSRKPKK